MIIKIKEGHRNILLNSESISEILYTNNSATIVMNNHNTYKLDNAEQIKHLLNLLNSQINAI